MKFPPQTRKRQSEATCRHTGEPATSDPAAVTWRRRVSCVFAWCTLTVLAAVVAFMGLVACRAIWNLDRPTGWAAGELLINYEGGFVRRGLFGQLFFRSERPLLLATQVQKWMVVGFVTGSTLMVYFWKTLPAALAYVALLCLAPGGLLHLATAGGFAFMDRKEIWFYVAMVVVIGCARGFGMFKLPTAIIVGLLSTVMILHHEAFAVFFVPPIVFCYLFYVCAARHKSGLIQMAVAMLPPLTAFAAVTLNSGDSAVAQAITQSYTGTDAAGVGGGITAIGWAFSTSSALSLRVLRDGSLVYWLAHFSAAIALAGLCLAFVPRNRLGGRLAWAVLCWQLAATCLLAYAGWDWGRWISLFTIGSALTLALVHVLAEHPVFGSPGRQSFWTGREIGAPVGGPRIALVLFVMAVPAILLSTMTRMASHGPQPGSLALSLEKWTSLFRVIR